MSKGFCHDDPAQWMCKRLRMTLDEARDPAFDALKEKMYVKTQGKRSDLVLSLSDALETETRRAIHHEWKTRDTMKDVQHLEQLLEEKQQQIMALQAAIDKLGQDGQRVGKLEQSLFELARANESLKERVQNQAGDLAKAHQERINTMRNRVLAKLNDPSIPDAIADALRTNIAQIML